MSNGARIVMRRAWKSDHPPQFNRRRKNLVAQLAHGKPLAMRFPFSLYALKATNPREYARREALALALRAWEGPGPNEEQIVDKEPNQALDFSGITLETKHEVTP